MLLRALTPPRPTSGARARASRASSGAARVVSPSARASTPARGSAPTPRMVGGGGRGRDGWRRSSSPSTSTTASPFPSRFVAARATPRVARRRGPDPPDDDAKRASASSASSDESADSRASANRAPGPGFDAETGEKLEWMEILEESAAYDPEIKDLLDGANSDPNTVERRIRERFEKRKEKVYQEREGSTVPMLVRFGEFRSHNLLIHLECHNPIAEQEQPLLEEVFKSWFVVAKLGGFNSENQQVQSQFYEVSNMTYDMELANGDSDVPTSVAHAMGGPEFNGKWCRAWLDLGSADEMCVDVLINALITFSREYFGIKTMHVGGEDVAPDWPLVESEFFVDDAGEMDAMLEQGPFRPPPRGTSVQGGMSR